MNFLEQIDARRMLAVLVALAAIAVMWGFGRWVTAPVRVPVLDDLDLEVVQTVTARLDEAGIEYGLERGGTRVTVDEADLARARVALAGEGLALSGRPGFELFDQPSWGMTDFTQRVNYRRALEGELERTLSEMRGVEEAKVHLALQESSLIRGDRRPAEASVVLALRGNLALDRAMVEGVQFLVAGSVEGMAVENVTVMDDGGRLLSTAGGPGGMGGMSAYQFGIRQEVEQYLESKAQELLDRIVGAQNASVRVAADLVFDRLDRTVQEVDPESQIAVQEEREEIVPGNPEQGASSTSTSATFETTRSVETLTREGARIARLSTAVLLNERPADGEGAWRSEELAGIQALVQNAVGLDPARGDRISVSVVPFEPVAAPEVTAPVDTGPGLVEWIDMLRKPVIGLLALILTAVVALRLMGALREPGRTAPAGALEAGPGTKPGLSSGGGATPAAGGEDTAGARAAPSPASAPKPDLPEPRGVEVKRPEMAARVVRAWLKEA